MIRAILRAQWLTMRAFRLTSSRRGAAISIVLAGFWYGFWLMLAGIAEEVMATRDLHDSIQRWLPLGLALVMVYWQLVPMASASMGASLDLRKLLVYPVPRRSLFFVEVMLRTTAASEMLILLAAACIGLLRNPAFGGWTSLPRVVAAMTVFVAFNLLLAAGLRNLISRLLTRKGVREVMILVLMLAGVMPRLLMVTGLPQSRLAPVLSAGSMPFWPWVAESRWLAGTPGDLPLWFGATACAAVLAVWTVFTYAFAVRQFARSLRFDEQAAQATRAAAPRRTWMERLYRFPGLILRDPLAAIVEKELRSLSRTPRFRLVFVMGFSFGVILWLPMALQGSRTHSAVADHFLVLVSVYALTLFGQVTYANCFGFDRSASQLYFTAPAPLGRALAGKNLAASIFIFLEVAVLTVACSFLGIGITPSKVAEAVVVTAIVAFYVLGIGNLSSVHYPRAMSPQKVSAGGSARRGPGLLALIFPVAPFPVALAYLARYAFHSQLAFDLLLVLAAALGVAIYWMATASAANTAIQRREFLVAELSRGEGPMAAD